LFVWPYDAILTEQEDNFGKNEDKYVIKAFEREAVNELLIWS
jgi:hypothetical protein